MEEAHCVWKRITAQKQPCISEEDYAKCKELITKLYFQIILIVFK